jgi:predicted AAA+ superfamily ATPase
LSNAGKSRDFAVLYRERIYYPSDAEERKMFLDEPSKYASQEAMPLDISYSPRIAILGPIKSGKTELAKTLASKTGAIHLSMDEIVQKYIDQDSVQCETLRKYMKQEGRGIDD